MNVNLLKKYLVILFLFVFIFLLIPDVSATYSRSLPQYSLGNYQSSSLTGMGTYSAIDQRICQNQQDFILQVKPFDCTPAVVRSDLLEEQNVGVFCKLTATKMNPLIDVNALRYITINGIYNKNVVSVQFYPLRSALQTSTSPDLSSPIMNDIGYAYIVLKQNANESSMPDFVAGNANVTLRYDAENAFGIGESIFYLPVVSDAEWKSSINRYSFWNGRAYIRADSVDENGAEISIYSDKYVSTSIFSSNSGDKLKLASLNLKEGETSSPISIPGLQSCLGNLKVQVLNLAYTETKARITVGTDVFEVGEGETFLNDQCTVNSITKDGINSEVKISCKSDTGTKTFYLKISPKINITIDGVSRDYKIGDYLYKDSSSGKSVYLGYIGTYYNSHNEEDLYAYLVASPDYNGLGLSADDLTTISKIASSLNPAEYKGKLANFLKQSYATIARGTKWAVYGDSLTSIEYSDKVQPIYGKNVQIVGFSSDKNSDINQNNENYDNAVGDYNTLISSFPSEKYSADFSQEFGELAMYQKLVLARDSHQTKSMNDLCKDFREKYPDSLLDISSCTDKYDSSNSELNTAQISISNQLKVVTLEDVYDPSFSDYNGEFTLISPDGSTIPLKLGKNGIYNIKSSDGKYPATVQLEQLSEDSAKIIVSITSTTGNSATEYTIRKDDSRVIGNGYSIKLNQINLKRYVKVKINPNIDYTGSQASFTYNLSIEKRSDLMKLSPDKAREKIENINKSLEDWQKISDALGTSVKTLKTACIATTAVLATKNFINNVGAEGIARQEVMKGSNGWNEICQKYVAQGKYSTLDECFFKNTDAIDSQVGSYQKVIESQNSEIKTLEAKPGYSTSSLSEGTKVLTQKFVNDYSPIVQNSLSSALSSGSIANPLKPSESISISEINNLLSPNNFANNYYNTDELRSIELYSNILKTNPDDANAKQKLYLLLKEIKASSLVNEEKKTFMDQAGVSDGQGALISTKKLTEIQFSSLKTFGEVKNNYDSSKIYDHIISDSENVFPVKDASDSSQYLLVISSDNTVSRTYDVQNVGGKLVLEFDSRGVNPLALKFTKLDSGSYNHKYISPELKYYESGAYNGLPAIVPVDVNKGWYAYATKYDESARVNNFWLCNVGQNGIQEFNSDSHGDDICQLINLGASQTYTQFYGLESSQVSSLVTKATDNIYTASQIAANKRTGYVTIGGARIKVGEPSVTTPDYQCTDFMSPKDCRILFNVCDPVLCPSSRCDFGGEYPVKDVVQSGIIGSIALCAPNYKEGIYMPVCLTGVQAGIDNLISISKSYRDCLQTGLDTGQTVGICDEIQSVYLCEFFWKQALPIAKLGIPKLLSVILGQNVHGGGEYLTLQNAWTNLDNSVAYFKNYYASNSFKAFQTRSLEEAGTPICQSFVSLTYPNGANILDQMTNPDSPPQFTGNFEEIPFSSITNPPTSQYKVYYHIYAGKDSGVYYRVYLKGSSNSYYKDTTFDRIVSSGYISKGEYASNTPDFTAPSGYTQLCIMVNDQEECGFKSVSTSFASTYIKDQYLASQSLSNNISSESECTSGSESLYNVLNINAEKTANEITNPTLADYGITRICATNNPGAGTDSSQTGENTRWVDVGTCGSSDMKCWLDTQSITNSITSAKVASGVVDSTVQNYLDALKSSGNYISDFSSVINSFKKMYENGNYTSVTANINSGLIDKAFYSNEKAYLIYIRGNAYSKLAINYFNTKYQEQIEQQKSSANQNTNIITTTETFSDSYASPIFEFQDGSFKSNIYYSYYNSEWHWSYDYNINSGWTSTDRFSDLNGRALDDTSKAFVQTLKGKNYYDGLTLLIQRTVHNNEGGLFSSAALKTSDGVASMDNEGIFIVKQKDASALYFKLNKTSTGDAWWWSPDTSSKSCWADSSTLKAPGTCFGKSGLTPVEKNVEVIKSIDGRNLYDGAQVIFDQAEKVKVTASAVALGESDIRALVLKTADNLVGTDSSHEMLASFYNLNAGSVSCYTSVAYVYNKSGAAPSCVYSDDVGKSYTINSNGNSFTVTTATNWADSNFVCSPYNQCSLSKLPESTKLDNIQPGDLLSMVYDKDRGHNVIFISWVDKTNGKAKLFDWNGFDKNGNKVYRYYEEDISDDSHPVYQIWKPVSNGKVSSTSTNVASTWTADSALAELNNKGSSVLKKDENGIINGADYSGFILQLKQSSVINDAEYSNLIKEIPNYNTVFNTNQDFKGIYLNETLLLKKQISDLCSNNFDVACALKLVDKIITENVNRNLGQKYSDTTTNTVFVDELHLNKLLDDVQYKEINGQGLFNLEGSMLDVKTMLQEKSITDYSTSTDKTLIDFCSQKIVKENYDALNELANSNNIKIDSLCNSNFVVTDNHVTALNLAKLEITSISSLSLLQNLEFLTLNENKITSVDSLKVINSLQKVSLEYNYLTDISSLKELTKINYLDVANNCIPSDYNYNNFVDKLGDQFIYSGNPRSDCTK